MAIRLNPYIGFRDQAREAIEFYHSVFGGKLTISTFKDLHAAEDPDEEDLVMHSMLEADNGLVLMCSDTPKRMEYKPGTNISVSLSGEAEDEETMRSHWDKLSDGGNVTIQLGKAIWGDTFGMVVDKFGIMWMVNIAAPKG
jgi:PhnB protein